MTDPRRNIYLVYMVLAACVAAIYLLPVVFPTTIGTGYILIVSTLMAFSVIIWHFQIISPKAALILSLLMCLCLGFLVPYTSNDSERYLWDGAVFLSGFDPYMTAPNDPQLAHLREIWPTPEEHSKYQTLYPPGGLTLFAICALAGPIYAIWVWKLLISCAVMLCLVITYKLLGLRGLSRNFHLIGFSPLLLFEAQLGAHLDVFSVLGIVSALWFIEKEKFILAGFVIGLAATTKFLPAVLVGPFLFYLKPKQALKLLLSSAGIWISIYASMIFLGYKPLGLLPIFFEKWRGGAPFYPVLEYLKNVLDISNYGFILSLILLALSGFSLSAWLAWRGRIYVALLLSLSIPLLLSPVLFPWYLIILVPFFALKPNWTIFAFIAFSPLSYVVLDRWLYEEIWIQPTWPAQVLLVSLIFGFTVDMIQWKLSHNDTLARVEHK